MKQAVIYSEDGKGVVVRKKSRKELERWLRWEIDTRQRLNTHKRIEVHGFNFDYRNYSDKALLMLFEKSEKEMFDRMFIKMY